MQPPTHPPRADALIVRDLATLTRADLDALPADDVEALRRFATVVRHPAGDVLFRRGQRAGAMSIVAGGAVELVAPTANDDIVVVQVISPGATIGVADERGSNTVDLRQADIAAAVGLSRQTVSRMLAELAAAGLIERGRVRILDRQRLHSLHEAHPAGDADDG